MERSTLQLSASGRYMDMTDGEETTSDITDHVNWSIPPAENAYATVSNDAPDKGLVTGVAVGSPNVTAACGDVLSSATVVEVIENDGSASGNLAFEEGSTRTINLGQTVQLNVSTGSVYDEDERITTDENTTWSVTLNSTVAEFLPGSTKGVITALTVGTARVRVLVDSEDDVDDAEAYQNIVVTDRR